MPFAMPYKPYPPSFITPPARTQSSPATALTPGPKTHDPEPHNPEPDPVSARARVFRVDRPIDLDKLDRVEAELVGATRASSRTQGPGVLGAWGLEMLKLNLES